VVGWGGERRRANAPSCAPAGFSARHSRPVSHVGARPPWRLAPNARNRLVAWLECVYPNVESAGAAAPRHTPVRWTGDAEQHRSARGTHRSPGRLPPRLRRRKADSAQAAISPSCEEKKKKISARLFRGKIRVQPIDGKRRYTGRLKCSWAFLRRSMMFRSKGQLSSQFPHSSQASALTCICAYSVRNLGHS
jgi:hypothetical protein